MDAFCQQVALTPKEVVMVGDTAVDIAFAKNAECALSIGVSSGASEMIELADADIVIPSVKFLLDQQDRYVWEGMKNK
ncbi:HAD family hydrolase [Bacillus sp. JCM 19034]|uniref:HAD family hydrolase n=1 Tax=Bacillus sp. JCM 19034 TaxID=1481928 RepID=UPI0018D0AD7C|nr:HAD hydrolase-like protein [Bacillus sp. JCM 19034]